MTNSWHCKGAWDVKMVRGHLVVLVKLTFPASQVDAAEVHFKKALLTRQVGLNRN